jgi:DNA-binding HxlR family transcriptional regulator
VLRFLLWRALGLLAVLLALALTGWLLDGGLGAALRGAGPVASSAVSRGSTAVESRVSRAGSPGSTASTPTLPGAKHLAFDSFPDALGAESRAVWNWAPGGVFGTRLLALSVILLGALFTLTRSHARRRREYVRLRVQTYRTDRASAEAVVGMFEALHKRLLCRWWRRLLQGQPSVALEVHHAAGTVWLAVTCPKGLEGMVQAALRTAYPNCRLTAERQLVGLVPSVLRLKKHAEFIKRAKVLDRVEHEREPRMNRLMTVLGADPGEAFVQVAMTPTPAYFERHAKRLFKRHEDRLSRERHDRVVMRDRSLVEDIELRGGLDVQHRPLFFVDLRVIARGRAQCEQIASELRAEEAENRLIERGTAVRHGLLGLYGRRVQRGEGNPVPSFHKGVFASTELAAVWHLPSAEYSTVPFARGVLPVAPAPPAILRPADGLGTLRDALGPVSIHPTMRKQNTAVPGTVEQGKSSYLVATVAEDLRRERCCVIVLDPKGDAAEAAVSLVPEDRTCTLLDLARPTCGFNPLAVDAPADVIADYVVAALKNLFTDADIRASSDRYLRNAIIAVLAHDRESTLWDAARLLSVGEEGYSYRARVGARVRALPEFKEISEFFTAELTAQLADARSMTTAKLDAPVNKLARLLNSQSIKRVLLNDSLRVDLDRVIAEGEVLVVKGALGVMGAGNTSVLMQLLVGMLDAALARQQDLVSQEQRTAVALKVDEAPLVLNRGFAETMALKRSAGLETVACWQTEAQWTEREVRDQLDALFAHRVYFATASVRDARASVGLTMAEFSDAVRPGIEHLSTLGHPDARLHLPRHHAIVSWSTPGGRQAPFVAETIPLRVDPERVALHAERQAERGGRYRTDLRQPHWDRERRGGASGGESDGKPEHAQTDSTQATAPVVRSEVTVEQVAVERGSPAQNRPDRVPAERVASGGDRPLGTAPLAEHIPEQNGSRLPAPQPRASAVSPGPANVVSSGPGNAVSPGPGNAVSPGPGNAVSAGPGNAVSPGSANAVSAGPGNAVSPGRGNAVSPGPANADSPGPRVPTDSYRELVELDGAHSVRWAKRVTVPRTLDPEALDLEILALVAYVRHVLSSQIHRRFNPNRAATTTQRRLKRLSDAGLVRRFQFHRRDGGGVPMCYAITAAGLELLHAHDRLRTLGEEDVDASDPPSPAAPVEGDRLLRQARHDVHVAGWVLALEHAVDGAPLTMRGAKESVLSPPVRSSNDGRRALGPADLTLPGGRSPHEFLRTDPTGARIPVERFETVRPDMTIELPGRAGGAIDLLVELDDRLPAGRAAGKLERYDHLLAGWSVHTNRYGRRLGAPPSVVFVCRDRARARECARRADALLTACRAYAGEYPADWEYPGRQGILFVAERDAHEGLLRGYGVPRLPPEVRVPIANGDPRAREAVAEARELVAVALPGEVA